MIDVNLLGLVGDFGEDKDVAAQVRETAIKPALAQGHGILLNFEGVTLVTQSFIHALISDILRKNGESVLDKLEFKNCSSVIQGIISTVVQYSLDTIPESTSE